MRPRTTQDHMAAYSHSRQRLLVNVQCCTTRRNINSHRSQIDKELFISAPRWYRCTLEKAKVVQASCNKLNEQLAVGWMIWCGIELAGC